MLMLARKFVNFILNTAGITHKSRNALFSKWSLQVGKIFRRIQIKLKKKLTFKNKKLSNNIDDDDDNNNNDNNNNNNDNNNNEILG